MSLTIGIPREIYPGEKRVAAVPDVVEKWRKLGFAVAIESGAGALANFADDTYIAAGATVADNAAALFAQADLILKVRAPTSAEVAAMRPGTTIISFIWPAQNRN
jgi:NAD(P) transhydrogenase subunit alpha